MQSEGSNAQHSVQPFIFILVLTCWVSATTTVPSIMALVFSLPLFILSYLDSQRIMLDRQAAGKAFKQLV
jgi:hypothetical protein